MDIALRAITDDQAFRVMAVRTTRTVEGAIKAQRAAGAKARCLAELITGAVLVRETMAPDLRVQALLQSGSRRIVADAFPRGETRGLVQMRDGELPLDEDARLIVMRTLHDGSIQQGVVAVPDRSVSGALMQYMQSSEQVTSIVAVGCIMRGHDEVEAAGGYIVQLLPGAPEGPLMLMTERMADFPPIDDLLMRGRASPEELLAEILYGIPHARVGDSTVSFKCQCSEERVAASLATLPRKDIQELMADGRVLELTCDYCGKEYRVPVERLRGLTSSN